MFNLITPKMIIYTLATVLVLAVAWRINHAFNEAAKVPGLQKQIEWVSQNNAGLKKSSAEFQKGKGQLDTNAENQNEEVKNEIKTVVVYHSCVVPDNGVQLVNKAIAARIK